MKILNEIFAMIESYPQTGSSGVLAAAMASACNSHYAGVNSDNKCNAHGA